MKFRPVYGKVLLDNAVDVAQYSFLAHKSASYLDLSTCELTSKERTTNTEEGFQKIICRSRKLLYIYHLDISDVIEVSMKRDPATTDVPIYVSDVHRGFRVQKNVYCRGFLQSITELIENSPDRLSEMRRFLRPMKMLGLCSGLFRCKQYRFFARILLEECKDSELVAEFADACGKFFRDWLVLDNDDLRIMEYVLYHAQKMNLEMYSPQSELFCPTSKSLFWGKVQGAVPLIKYGKIRIPAKDKHVRKYIQFSCMYRPYHHRDLFPTDFTCFNPVRKWLLLQLVHVFCGQTTSPGDSDFAVQALRLIWRSMPDAYLSGPEIWSVFSKSSEHSCKCEQICTFYRDVILCGEEGGCEVQQPRSLLHLARCAIRGRLAANLAVPSGIEHIGLPMRLQSYLKLER